MKMQLGAALTVTTAQQARALAIERQRQIQALAAQRAAQMAQQRSIAQARTKTGLRGLAALPVNRPPQPTATNFGKVRPIPYGIIDPDTIIARQQSTNPLSAAELQAQFDLYNLFFSQEWGQAYPGTVIAQGTYISFIIMVRAFPAMIADAKTKTAWTMAQIPYIAPSGGGITGLANKILTPIQKVVAPIAKPLTYAIIGLGTAGIGLTALGVGAATSATGALATPSVTASTSLLAPTASASTVAASTEAAAWASGAGASGVLPIASVAVPATATTSLLTTIISGGETAATAEATKLASGLVTSELSPHNPAATSLSTKQPAATGTTSVVPLLGIASIIGLLFS
jgi:hypothetical protein